MAAAYVAPARYPLTELHRRDLAVGPVMLGPHPSDGATVCGKVMLADEQWQETERRDGDRLCVGCLAPDSGSGAERVAAGVLF